MVEQIVSPRNFIVNLDDCYPEKLIVNRGEAEVDNDISRGNLGVTFWSKHLKQTLTVQLLLSREMHG